MTMTMTGPSVGDILRDWRARRRLSQLDLAGDAAISARHLSFVETGRASASREMLIRLAEQLAMPLRARNQLLNAAGYAAIHPERPIDAPDMRMVRGAIERIIEGHLPFPALAVDRGWNLVTANAALGPFLAEVDPALLVPPVNVLRLSLHPKGLAPSIDNLAQWRGHLLARLRQQADQTGDRALDALHDELARYPGRPPGQADALPAIVVPLRIRLPGTAQALSFISTTTVFGTPLDVTLAELALECFYPADEATRRALAG